MIFADENLEQYWIDLLITKQYPVYSIRDKHPGISDLKIAELVRTAKGVLITEDKDFGELIFSYGFKDISTILLRYDQPQYDQIEHFLLKVLEEYSKREGHFFITITKKKIRIREI